MEFNHTTVLLKETLQGLNIDPKGIYADGTLGGGGHAFEICKQLQEQGLLIGIDRDTDALQAASKTLDEFDCRKAYVQSNYADIKNVLEDLNLTKINGAVLDLGVSSFQLDNPQRGFSYMKNAPLDMRMNQDDRITAEDVINEYDKKELYRIIRDYGEEKWAARIAEFIEKERKKKRITTTEELVSIIKAAIPSSARREGPHPAKRTFQAIRIEVNDELGQLKNAVKEFIDVLEPKGRLCIITFHSLEDRIVKDIFNEAVSPCICPKTLPMCACGRAATIKKITGKPMIPSKEELQVNPRSRSAKLRIIEKL